MPQKILVPQGRVLIIAGSDSGGGAGIQADIKTVTSLGGYAMTAITALTAQNTQGVFGIMEVAPGFVQKQIDVVLSDIGADCIKTGMLHNIGVIEAVAESLAAYPDIPLIIDPVMITTSGDSLLNNNAINTLKKRLIAKATLVTPNIPEAETLTGLTISNKKDMLYAAGKLLKTGVKAVLLKGGHGNGGIIYDILKTADGIEKIFKHPRIKTTSTHGTGCTLASAIACNIANGLSITASVSGAIDYVINAIKTAKRYGKGNSPLNHTLLQKK